MKRIRGLFVKNVISVQASRNYMLETTKIKLLKGYEDSTQHVQKLIEENNRLSKLVSSDSEFSSQQNKMEIFKRLTYLNEITELNKKIEQNKNDLRELQEMMENSDEKDDMKEMFKEDLARLSLEIENNKLELVRKIIPDDLEDKEDAIVELSAGVGGNESKLFCSEMYTMYEAYSAKQNWTFRPVKVYTDVIDHCEMMRQAYIEITGTNVFKYFKFESGVHRVQRVPKTEAKGRIHTSTVGVVVTPKPAEIKIEINPKDLKIETKTTSGPGGQHVNKTESAVRVLHIPTGILVYSDEERHQIQNRARAMENLKQKLYQKAFEEQLARKQMNRKLQVGSASRSERIRTYNFIQDRITDHRLDENFTGISQFLSGELLYDMIECLKNEQLVDILYELLENSENDKNK